MWSRDQDSDYTAMSKSDVLIRLNEAKGATIILSDEISWTIDRARKFHLKSQIGSSEMGFCDNPDRCFRTVAQLVGDGRNFVRSWSCSLLFCIVDVRAISVIKWPARDDRALKLPERRRYRKGQVFVGSHSGTMIDIVGKPLISFIIKYWIGIWDMWCDKE
jgi:hypothetical protein